MIKLFQFVKNPAFCGVFYCLFIVSVNQRAIIFSIIESWAEAKRIDAFFKDAQLRTIELSENDRLAVETKLIEARKLLGTLDALERFKQWKSPIEREQLNLIEIKIVH